MNMNLSIVVLEIIIIIIKALIKHKILYIATILSAYMHTNIHTQVPAHTSILTISSLIYT